ncbi:hypothetical protein BaRGS_00022659 [Batillaria attramentaria]|uniref:Uncharacterized protein n=1 Tax=Batillaria attramentaria TaxID=370345 RepID=A0ABD0KGD3_9CAEN
MNKASRYSTTVHQPDTAATQQREQGVKLFFYLSTLLLPVSDSQHSPSLLTAKPGEREAECRGSGYKFLLPADHRVPADT